ncbi:MAG: heparan-alpha-glucosaminide N-acetyltransferase domain-containing protein [Marinilabiliaceae bacterium]|nr:heparan-alpha-glucosaminide N-acetyltransferase domain-containing protein [Marinilabiliaceae bacterium]
MNKDNSNTNSKRLVSLDVLRGLTVFGMILVNNGAGKEHFEALKHSAWNGLTPCDLVFPFFLFIVGVSIYISLSKRKASFEAGSASSLPTLKKILYRTTLLFIIGIALHAWDMLLKGQENLLANLRLTSVLQRIALSYGIASIIFLYVKPRYLWAIVLALLGGYSYLLLAYNGYAPSDENFANTVDRAVFGAEHLYRKGPIDPEGIPGLISSVAHTIIGVLVGMALFGKEVKKRPLARVLIVSVVMIGVACLLSVWLPINKRVWSPSYVFVTCGLATALLVLLTIVVDEKGHDKWCKLFQIFGLNALGLYVISEMLPAIFGLAGIYDAVWGAISSAISFPRLASLFYALFFCSVMSIIAWLLWRFKIFIKL